jgi:hypothetical protein
VILEVLTLDILIGAGPRRFKTSDICVILYCHTVFKPRASTIVHHDVSGGRVKVQMIGIRP